MTTVSTWRTERITCDEEERIRKGYEISSHFRFASKDGRTSKISAEVIDGAGNSILKLSYGPAAHLWRINRKWRKRGTAGFTLDLANGVWDRRTGDISDTALSAGQNNICSGVQVLVRDTKNILLVQPATESSIEEDELANLQYALQKGICAAYKIDEGEIASERIGQGEQRSILYWEAAEGGVGVLQRLVEESSEIGRIAREALEICHFDRETGEELSEEIDCARACYECLLTYRNQRDHINLNRHTVRDILMTLAEGKTMRTYEHRTYDEHYEWLRRQTDSRSQLEKDFLDQLYREGRRLPDHTQKPLSNYYSIPDFYYNDGYVCVFCDGTPHDEPEQKRKDDQNRANLRSLGYRVIVIRYDRPLKEQIEEHNDIFGVVKNE
jgi:very-short-patch-repair endonuclease